MSDRRYQVIGFLEMAVYPLLALGALFAADGMYGYAGASALGSLLCLVTACKLKETPPAHA